MSMESLENRMTSRPIVVIGGGAAGMMAAITAAEQGAAVTLLEPNERLGKKLNITGKGRCNVTNNAGLEELLAHMEGTVTEENKGGIVVSVKGVRVFVPASQSGLPRGADLSSLVKQKVQLRITEVNRARRRVVGSIRSVNDEARKAAQTEIWDNIEAGKHYTGTVKSMW